MEAVWISPDGKIMEVGLRHIYEIIGDPAKYGLTSAYIKSVYRKHREPVGSEGGHSREEIMLSIMEKSGWIRIRYIPRQWSITVQVSDRYYGENSWADLVTGFARWARKRKDFPETANVVILNLAARKIYPDRQLYEIASGALYERVKKGTYAEFLNPKRGKVRMTFCPKKGLR